MGQKRIIMAFTLVFVFIITFSVTATVKGAEKTSGKMGNNYLAQIEKEYRKELKRMLEEEGYSNAGITMTKIRQQDGVLEYTVKINHKKLSKSTENKREEIRLAMEEIEFQDCMIEYEFL